jgi:hypothetical protein
MKKLLCFGTALRLSSLLWGQTGAWRSGGLARCDANTDACRGISGTSS